MFGRKVREKLENLLDCTQPKLVPMKAKEEVEGFENQKSIIKSVSLPVSQRNYGNRAQRLEFFFASFFSFFLQS